MSLKGLQLQSTVLSSGDLQLSTREVDIPEPTSYEVVVKIQAAPVNPSDIFTLFSSLNPASAEATEVDGRPAVILPAHGKMNPDLKARQGNVFVPGNEGAGRVIATGDSDIAKALSGKLVGLVGGEMYADYRVIDARACLAFDDSVTPVQACSPFVNPMTALAMADATLREGHQGIIHNAAASNLGQMLNRICLADGINLINLVRRDEQVELLKAQGAKYVISTTSDNFEAELVEAIAETKASIAFDPVFGGELSSTLIRTMETAWKRHETEYSGYRGAGPKKQIYVYGMLSEQPMIVAPGFSFNWSISSFLLNHYLESVEPEVTGKMRARVAKEITTTFASHYAGEISLTQAADAEFVRQYATRKTAQKYVIAPNGSGA